MSLCICIYIMQSLWRFRFLRFCMHVRGWGWGLHSGSKVQNGTQQDLNKMIDLVNLGGKKSVYMLKMGGFEMEPNKIWIKMVYMVKFWGAKRSSRCRKWGAKPRRIPTDSQRGSAPPPPGFFPPLSTVCVFINLCIESRRLVVFGANVTCITCTDYKLNFLTIIPTLTSQ